MKSRASHQSYSLIPVLYRIRKGGPSTSKVGQTRISSLVCQFFDHEDRRARSAYQVAHSKAPGPGITERASEGPGKARKACFRRKFDSSALRRRNATRAADLNRSCRAGRTAEPDEVLRMGRKVASWKALAELYKSLSSDEFRDVEVESWGVSKDTRRAAMSQDRRSSPGGLAEEEDTRHDGGGVSNDSPRRTAA
ncbi:hypothetical protein THAOC_20944 [Thalassiosira oceanica]|uniref:Uncharacterized protein n=1 Tax=Thalassiosira oceanica TaxID=159749 RepID=K0SK76_THAOC|nr:hypothetical protein THAOC_20944 [Thalassiosira oceanica]|eukprot:EJK58897.1 hypothetical protein THAOC_20944 [Thalassiosira oceanica]